MGQLNLLTLRVESYSSFCWRCLLISLENKFNILQINMVKANIPLTLKLIYPLLVPKMKSLICKDWSNIQTQPKIQSHSVFNMKINWTVRCFRHIDLHDTLWGKISLWQSVASSLYIICQMNLGNDILRKFGEFPRFPRWLCNWHCTEI